jgi:hypothetical protein
VTLQKYFSHASLVIYFLETPTHETEIRTASKLVGELPGKHSKPPGTIITLGQSEILSSSQIISTSVACAVGPSMSSF